MDDSKIQLEVTPAELEIIRAALDMASSDSDALQDLLDRVTELTAQHPASDPSAA